MPTLTPSTLKHYIPPDRLIWQGRVDEGKRFHQLVEPIDLRQQFKPNQKFALIGFACDEGVKRNSGRAGAKEGPKAFRQALAKLPSVISFHDVGDIVCDDGDLETAQEALGHVVGLLLSHGVFPFVVGGGHEVSWGHYLGIAETKKNQHLSIVNFDAHYDLRPLLNGKGTSGTSFTQIKNHIDKFDYTCIGIQRYGNTDALKQRAKELGVNTVYAEDVDHELNPLDAVISRSQSIFLTVDLDVFATPFAPGVSAPQALGLTPSQIIKALEQLASSKKLVSFEIAELNPAYDPDGRTAALAASLASVVLHHV